MDNKIPVFNTEDGVDVFEGELYYIVYTTKDFRIGNNHATFDNISPKGSVNKLFSTELAAEEYVEFHRPQYSLFEIQRAFNINGGVCCYNDFIKELSHD